MKTRMNKNNSVSPGRESTMVGVEESWPLLFKVMGLLGLVLAKRNPSGCYETSWLRLIPMGAIMTSMCWCLFTYPHMFYIQTYDTLLEVVTLSISVILTAYAFVLAIHSRRETCILFAGLKGTQEPTRMRVFVASSLLGLLYTLFYLGTNYFLLEFKSVAHWIFMTLTLPLMPSLLDLVLVALIDALHKAYKGKVHQLSRSLRQQCFQTWSSSDFKVLQVI